MISEILVILSVLLSGIFVLRSFGFKGWALTPISFLLGTSLFTLIITIQALLMIPVTYLLPVAITPLMAFILWLYRLRVLHIKNSSISLPYVLGSAAVLALLVSILWQLNILVFSTDTIRQSLTSSLISSGDLEYLSKNLSVKRYNSISVINSMAFLYNSPHIRALPAIITLATTGALVWSTQVILASFVRNKNTLKKASIFAALLFVSNYGVWWQLFYHGAHILQAGLLLIAITSGWLLTTRNSKHSNNSLAILMVLSVFGIIMSRPEAGILIPVAFLPIILTPSMTLRVRKFLTLSLGVSLSMQQGVVLYSAHLSGINYPKNALLLFALGIMLTVLSQVINHDLVSKNQLRILFGVEIAAWAALLLFTLRDPALLFNSLDGMIKNVIFGQGLWGLSYILILFLLLISFLSRKQLESRLIFRYPLTTFLPLGLLMAYLREVPYRAGVYDTLNRMFMHILPLIIVLVIVTFFLNTAKTEKNLNIHRSKL